MNNESMTPKERILCAMRGGQPDRVSVQLGILTIAPRMANETDLDSINPLQPPPMGDCDLAEVKRTFGKRLCLKGNVGVTEPMLTGTPADVERDVLRCLEAAKDGGGYILFTEEGLGRNTPFANIRKYIEVGKREGRY